MTNADFIALPTNSEGHRYVPGFAGSANRTHTLVMPAGGAHMIAVWGNQSGVVSQYNDADLQVSVRSQNPPTGMTVRVGGQLVASEADAIGTHRVMANSSVALYAGNAPRQTFLGWRTYAAYTALPTNADGHRFIPNFTGPANRNHTLVMPEGGEHMVALWGNQQGVVSQYNNFSIIYNANGGVNPPAARSGLLPSSHALTIPPSGMSHRNMLLGGQPVPVRFAGWSLTRTTQIFRATELAQMPTLITDVTIIDSDVTVYAVWRFANVTVDANYGPGGDEIIVDVIMPPPGDYTVSVAPPDRIIVVIPDTDASEVIVSVPGPGWTYERAQDGDDVRVTIIAPPDSGYELVRLPDGNIAIYITVRFVAGENGRLQGVASRTVRRNTVLAADIIPTPIPDEYSRFVRWTSNRAGISNPLGHRVIRGITFTANFESETPPPPPPGPGGDGRGNWWTPPIPRERVEVEVPEYEVGTHTRFVYGFPDGTMRADTSITRAEVAMIIFRLLEDGNKFNAAPSQFSDVAYGSWYAQAVNYLAHMNILLGYPDGTFRPNASITRAEFTAIVVRFFGAGASGQSNFSDVSPTHWASIYINAAFSNGWILGHQDGTFRPDNAITRAEAVVIINRLLGRIANPETIRDSLGNMRVFSDLTSAHWAFYNIMEASISHTYRIDQHDNEVWVTFALPFVLN